MCATHTHSLTFMYTDRTHTLTHSLTHSHERFINISQTFMCAAHTQFINISQTFMTHSPLGIQTSCNESRSSSDLSVLTLIRHTVTHTHVVNTHILTVLAYLRACYSRTCAPLQPEVTGSSCACFV